MLATRAGARLEDLQDSMMYSDPRTTRGYQAEALALDNDRAHLLGDLYT